MITDADRAAAKALHSTWAQVNIPILERAFAAHREAHEQCRCIDGLIVERESYRAEAAALRKLLWLSHGHDGLYGDDGEMQCARCRLDFKRDPIWHIDERFVQLAMDRLRVENEAREKEAKPERPHE